MSGRRSSNKGARTERARRLLLGHGLPARDLFGRPDVPDRPGPKYQRLSRYDQTGLVWLLRGRRVVEFTKDKAVIETATGTPFPTAGHITQADVARVIRAAKQEGVREIEVRVGAASIMMRIPPSTEADEAL